MRRTMGKVALLAGLALLTLAAAKGGVEPGQKAPQFELFGVDYKYHSLEKYEDARGIAVVFTCNHCPVARAYEDELVAIAKEYQPKGIQFIAINPNPADMMQADGFPQMIERAKEKGVPFPYVYDETQKVARAYGATVTPHVFPLDGERSVVYMGAIDNRHKEPNYLRDAMDDLLAGREIEEPDTAQFGCSVKYRKEEEPAEE